MDEQNNMESTSPKSPGSMIGSIIVVIILIVGAIYLFSTRGEPRTDNGLPAGEDEAVGELQMQSDSDELEAIEADLEATDFGSLEAGVSDLNQAGQ